MKRWSAWNAAYCWPRTRRTTPASGIATAFGPPGRTRSVHDVRQIFRRAKGLRIIGDTHFERRRRLTANREP